MSAFSPVGDIDDLASLDPDEITAGYIDFCPDDPEPGVNRGRAYWHGWMNAARDAGIRPPTPEAARLARQLYGRRRP